MQLTLQYDHRTAVLTEMNTSAVDFAANTRRMPVSFRGTLRDPVLMRRLMVAMHEVILGDFREDQRAFVLDPVITVHPDEVFFEAFSTDQSTYVRLSAAMDAFDLAHEPTCGTTNIDFTFALRDAMQNLRSSRQTTFTVGGSGFGVQTGVGAVNRAHFESKVDLPDPWVRGFLQVQSALAMRPFTFDVRAVDLLTVIAYIIENNARKPPRGLRFEFKPDQPVVAVLEPWNTRFTLRGTHYTGYERTVRLWGRKRLELLLEVLPYAEKVTIGVLGRSLPHFYICHCGPYKFTLMLSGWVRSDFAGSGALDLLAPQTPVSDEEVASVYNFLNARFAATQREVEAHTLLNGSKAETALFALCRAGRAMYDPTTRRYRSRELFAEPLDFDTFLAPDPRIARARALVEQGHVAVRAVTPSETRRNELKVFAEVESDGTNHDVMVAVDRELRIKFVQCQCAFYLEHMMALGPCEHALAARLAAEESLAAYEAELMLANQQKIL